MSTFNSADIAAFKGGVWVFCEQRQGSMMPTSFELISEGRKLADEANRALATAGKQLDKAEKKQVKTDIAALQKLLAKKVDKVSEADVAALRAATAQLERSSAHARSLAGN